MHLRTRLALGVSAAFGLAFSAMPLVARADPPAPSTDPGMVVERVNGRTMHRATQVIRIRGERQEPLRFDIGGRARDTYVRAEIPPPFAPQVIHATRESPF